MFREDKTTQMAGQFLARSGGSMPYLLLMKLLYIADKQMHVRHVKPITYDRWFSMARGPVLSSTYDLIKAGPNRSTYWSDHIATSGYDVVLKANPGDDDLSRAEDAIIDQTFREWGHKDQWDVVELTHNFPEWKDPGTSSDPIPYERVLRSGGIPRAQLEDILEDIAMQDDVWALPRAVEFGATV